MRTVGQKFPVLSLKGVVSENVKEAFIDVNIENNLGQWCVYFFWPKDFTFVCPTEIVEFGNLYSEFVERDTKVFGISTDSEFVHLAWRQHKKELQNLPFPMLADVKRELSFALGIIDENEGVSQRATFIVDPEGIIRFVMVTDLNVGRNPREVLRVLDALQTNELCPCNWQKDEATIQIG